MKFKDYYAILGVDRQASADDIRKRYRILARKYHPDVSKEPEAERRFKEVAEASATLRDPEKRAAYDQLGTRRPGEDFRPPPEWSTRFGDGAPAFDGMDFAGLAGRAARGGHGGRRPARGRPDRAAHHGRSGSRACTGSSRPRPGSIRGGTSARRTQVTSDFCNALWLEEHRRLALGELADLSGLTEAEVVELVECGALAPAGAAPGQWLFGIGAISVARTARRLGDEFALEPHAVARVLAYLDRIRELEAELRAARARGTFGA